MELFLVKHIIGVFKKQGEACNEKKTVSTVTYGGGSKMFVCFAAFGTGYLKCVQGIIKSEDYQRIQQDNDHKYTFLNGLFWVG